MRRHVDPRFGRCDRGDRALHACEHYYVLFQDVAGLTPDLPVLRDYDHCSYFKYDAGKLLVGAFERMPARGAPAEYPMTSASAKLPAISVISSPCCWMRCADPGSEKAGIQKFFCGPESFTPDVRYHLGSRAN